MSSRRPVLLSGRWLLVLVTVLLVLNLFTFLPAFSQVSTVDSGCCSNHPLAKDFSGVYIGAWRLFHDPAQIYFHGYVNDGEPFIYPQPEQYKYLPSFLIITSPLLALPYGKALAFYDVLQFALLPLIGILVYRLTREQGWMATIVAETLVLLLPSPVPGWGFSVAYFWQWKEGQSKVIETLLLTASLYLGKEGRSVLSGVILGIAFFDPRFALISSPLFLTFNAAKLSTAVKSFLVTLTLSNAALLYPALGISFVEMVFSTGISTALYPYAIIPLAETVFLTFINYYEVRTELGRIVKELRSRMIWTRIRTIAIRRA